MIMKGISGIEEFDILQKQVTVSPCLHVLHFLCYLYEAHKSNNVSDEKVSHPTIQRVRVKNSCWFSSIMGMFPKTFSISLCEDKG